RDPALAAARRGYRGVRLHARRPACGAHRGLGPGGPMKVGIPTEIKTDEYRVAITPAGVRELTERGHDVFIQSAAGEGSAMKDEDYVAQGAQIVADAQSVFDEAELILKVKEPQPEEVAKLRPEHTLFTYLHLAPP